MQVYKWYTLAEINNNEFVYVTDEDGNPLSFKSKHKALQYKFKLSRQGHQNVGVLEETRSLVVKPDSVMRVVFEHETLESDKEKYVVLEEQENGTFALIKDAKEVAKYRLSQWLNIVKRLEKRGYKVLEWKYV